jgi:hypothetical protein
MGVVRARKKVRDLGCTRFGINERDPWMRNDAL